MVEKSYKWTEGATLLEHSRQKHRILREYIFEYIFIRCQLPQQERFRIAFIDGFAGGGKYACGASGSPLIFMEELLRATGAINLNRHHYGLAPLNIECLMILNDSSPAAIRSLRAHIASTQGIVIAQSANLHIHPEYLNEDFETGYQKIKDILKKSNYKNVLFNLDQCGHSRVKRNTLTDIMQSYKSAEIFYTFSIDSLLAFLNKKNPTILSRQLRPFGLNAHNLQTSETLMSQQEWLGAAERIVFDSFRSCAPFVSPFSINNPDGWRYWLIHFANVCRARQVYNSILHKHSSAQAHFGRSGLNMLSYDPNHEGTLYLFEDEDRKSAKIQLLEDIPRFISESGNEMRASEFYKDIYNLTPAHADDVNAAIISNTDLEVFTATGGKRRKAHTIKPEDILKLKSQKSFFLAFPN